MKRTDFRPNELKSGNLSAKDRKLIEREHTRTPRGNKQPLGVHDKRSIGRTTSINVVDSFLHGESDKSSKDNLHTDGKHLYSYNTVIATKQSDGTVIVNNTKYSATTSKQQRELISQLKENKMKYDVTGDKGYNYEGEDFSENNDNSKTFKYQNADFDKNDYPRLKHNIINKENSLETRDLRPKEKHELREKYKEDKKQLDRDYSKEYSGDYRPDQDKKKLKDKDIFSSQVNVKHKTTMYKGYRIEKNDGVYEVVKNDSRFIVALDDSKSSGQRTFNDKANNIKTSKKYIDWITRNEK